MGGDDWLGQLWSGLGGKAQGYQGGGAVNSPGMDIYAQAMQDLDRGGIGSGGGYAMGGPVVPGAQQVSAPSSPMNQPIGAPVAGAGYSWANPVPQNQPVYTGVQGLAHGGEVRKAEDLAQYGRNGDTTLMHINPAELEGLQQLLGPVTENPDTGMPEAFAWVPFLIGAAIGSVGTGAATDWDPKAMALGGLAGGVTAGSLTPAAGGGAAAGGGNLATQAALVGTAESAAANTLGPTLTAGSTHAFSGLGTALPTEAAVAASQNVGYGTVLTQGAMANMDKAAGAVLAGGGSGPNATAAAGLVSGARSAPPGGIAGLLKANGPKIAKAGAGMLGGGGQKGRPTMPPPPAMAQPKRPPVQAPPRNVPRPATPGRRLASNSRMNRRPRRV